MDITTLNTSNFSKKDRRTAKQMVKIGNKEIQKAIDLANSQNTDISEQNIERAAEVPPLDPLPLVEVPVLRPNDTNSETKESYEAYLIDQILQAHNSYTLQVEDIINDQSNIKQLKSAALDASDDQISAALTALTTTP